MKALYEQMMDLYLIFQFVKGCCHGNQIMLQKHYQRRLIPLAFIDARIAISWSSVVKAQMMPLYHENFVKFGPVTSELTVLICERQVRHGQKTGLFRRISPDILDRFSQSFHRMKALYVQMMDLSNFVHRFAK